MASESKIEIGLNATMVAIVDGTPAILATSNERDSQLTALPYGQFNPSQHRTMEMGLRELVKAQTGIFPGYVEQLYTFGDRGRLRVETDESPHVVSVGYLALARILEEQNHIISREGAFWTNWYDFLPWEDWRNGRPSILDERIIPALIEWARDFGSEDRKIRGLDAETRIRMCFGLEAIDWDDEQVLERYELMYSAGLLSEAVTDGRLTQTRLGKSIGVAMVHDHRRILATAIARLRGKLKYRPVIFELMPDSFTLFDLQQTVESIFGRAVHKQNFRRLVENANLVEPTGAHEHLSRGRPAALFRFRRDILKERPAPGLRVGGR